jgi:hypothetical protein
MAKAYWLEIVVLLILSGLAIWGSIVVLREITEQDYQREEEEKLNELRVEELRLAANPNAEAVYLDWEKATPETTGEPVRRSVYELFEDDV